MFIFVSYRRGDSRHVAGRLRDCLSWEAEVSSVFFDTQSVPPGTNFPSRIEKGLRRATHVLVVIGPAWEGGKPDGASKARIMEEGDFVRREVALALTLTSEVIPVLVDGAAMPSKDRLPPELHPLVSINAYRIDNDKAFSEQLTPLLTHMLGHAPRGGDTLLTVALKAIFGACLGTIAFLLFSAYAQLVLGLTPDSLFDFTDRESAQALWGLLLPLFALTGAVAVPLLRRRWWFSFGSR